MNLCVIPARGGSKRIPKKNIRNFCGKPIIFYSIKAAIESECFDKIIVSTDSKEISDVAKYFGIEAPFTRPSELADDYTETIPVIKHAIEWFEHKGHFPDSVCCLYPTAPFIQSKTIQSAFNKLLNSKVDYCLTATTFPYPIQRAIRLTENKKISMFYPEFYSTRSQDLVESYHDAGQLYLGKASTWKSKKQLFSDESTAIILPRHLVQDIDNFEDWKRAELMYELLKSNGELV